MEILLELTKILRPFAEITATTSGEKYVTGGDLIVVTRIIQETCHQFDISEINEQARAFVAALSADMKKDTRLGNVEKMETFALCTFLDPRYKMAAIADQAEARNTKRKVLEMVEHMKNTNQESEAEPDNSSNANNRNESVRSVFDNFMSEKISTQQSTPFLKATKEVQMYVDDGILLRRDSQGKYNFPRKWWLLHRNIYPNLAEIYRRNCNVVGTSVPCERIFSKALSYRTEDQVS